MLKVKIMADEKVDLFRDGRYVLAACQMSRHPECQVVGINVEHGAPLGYDHQVTIAMEAKYDVVFQHIRDAITANIGVAATSTVGGE